MNASDMAVAATRRESPVAQLLDARRWAYQTRTFRAINFEFAVRTTDGALGEYLDLAMQSLAVDDQPAHTYSLVEREGRSRRRFTLYLDNHRADSCDTHSAALHYLLWHINREVVSTGNALMLHASAVARGRRAVVFAAPMESGKSTIAAALVRAGLDYVTDEAVAFDANGRIEPYPRPIALESGSWPLFAELAPAPSPQLAPYLGRQWQVPPTAIRPDSVAGPCQAAVIVKLRYDPTAPTSVQDMSRSHMIPWLAEQSFNFHALGADGLSRLAAIVSGARCVDLSMSDLDEACSTVFALLDTEGSR